MAKTKIVTVIDNTDRLSVFWRLGLRVNRSNRDLRASSWEHAYDLLVAEDAEEDVREVHFWGHGQSGRPMIAGKAVDLERLDAALPAVRTVVWRMCDVHKGQRGHAFARDVVQALGANSVGHAAIVAAPNPLSQRAVCAYTPEMEDNGVLPGWPLQGQGLPSWSTLSMKVPWNKALRWRYL